MFPGSWVLQTSILLTHTNPYLNPVNIVHTLKYSLCSDSGHVWIEITTLLRLRDLCHHSYISKQMVMVMPSIPSHPLIPVISAGGRCGDKVPRRVEEKGTQFIKKWRQGETRLSFCMWRVGNENVDIFHYLVFSGLWWSASSSARL